MKSEQTGIGQYPTVGGSYPISIVKTTSEPLDCPVFGEKIEIITASLRPFLASHVSPKRPVGQAVSLRTGGLQSSHWRHKPIVPLRLQVYEKNRLRMSFLQNS